MAFAAVAAICAGGCGHETITSSVKPPPTSAGPGNGTVVGIRGGTFVPMQLIVLVGHPVMWENFDPVAQRVVASSGASFRSRPLQTGQVFTWTPHRPGVIRYENALHPRVVATIRVTS